VGSGWTLIGGNPAPGDVGVLETASGSVYQVREEANDFVRQVRGILAGWAGSGWSGPAASKFEEFLQAAGQHLSQMESAHEPVGNALTAHATALAEQQPIATRALQAAERAQARRDTASDRQASARAQYARAEQSHTQATSELSRIESAITTRVQELEAVGTQILGDLLHVADPDLQSLFGEQREWTGAQNVARDLMEGAARVIGDMEELISDAEAAFGAAIRLANDVRSEVERSASHARSLISDADNDLSNVWHHVGQDLGLHADDAIHIAEELLVGLGVASGLLAATAGPTGAAVVAPNVSGLHVPIAPYADPTSTIPSPPSPGAQQALTWAEKELDDPQPPYNVQNSTCYRFVYTAYAHATKNLAQSQLPHENAITALHHFQMSKPPGWHTATTPPSPPPKGAIVFYETKTGTEGHAAISVGTGQVICTQTTFAKDPTWPGLVKVPYVGKGLPNTGTPRIYMSKTGNTPTPEHPSYFTYKGWYLPN